MICTNFKVRYIIIDDDLLQYIQNYDNNYNNNIYDIYM